MTLPTSGPISLIQVRDEIQFPTASMPAVVDSNKLGSSYVVRSLANSFAPNPVSMSMLRGKSANYRAVMTFSNYSSNGGITTVILSNYLGGSFFGGRLAYIQSGSSGGIPNSDMYVIFDSAYPAPTWGPTQAQTYGQLYVKNMSSGVLSSPMSKQDNFTWMIRNGWNLPVPSKNTPNPTADTVIRVV